jgi:predicted NUDIX family phosphoesterase
VPVGPRLLRQPLPPAMEFVLVVPRRDLFPEHYPQGFVPFGDGFGVEGFERTVARHGFFVERERAEHDPELKQIIPYTLVTRSTERSPEVLLLRRLARGGEARLHDKLSIGVGGHLEPVDAGEGRASVLDAGTRRELSEELDLDGSLEWRRVGILNDDSNPVGAVHVGLVQVARARGNVAIREADVLAGDFTSLERLAQLCAQGANFETWSALLVERLADLVQETTAGFPHRLEPTGAQA